jgi:hypothetical protein
MLAITALMVLLHPVQGLGQGPLKLHIHSIEGYGPNEGFARRTSQILLDVFNSEEFRTELLSEQRRYKRRQGLAHDELFRRITDAKEVQGPAGQVGVVDMRVRTIRVDGDESYWKKRCAALSTYGIDGIGDGVMAVCPAFLEQCVESNDYGGLAAHYAHEYMHILGFDHIRCIPKSASFVYQVGEIVELIVNRWKAEGKLV